MSNWLLFNTLQLPITCTYKILPFNGIIWQHSSICILKYVIGLFISLWDWQMSFLTINNRSFHHDLFPYVNNEADTDKNSDFGSIVSIKILQLYYRPLRNIVLMECSNENGCRTIPSWYCRMIYYSHRRLLMVQTKLWILIPLSCC